MADPHWLSEREQRFWRAYLDLWRELERRLHAELMRSSGLSGAEFAILVPLSESPEGRVRARDLCQELSWDRTRLSHLVARMEKRGFVRRTPCADDARGSMVEMAEDGRRAIEQAAPPHVDAVRRYLIDQLDDRELATMTAAFERALGQLRPS